ncbi:response regulator [Flavobacterium sp. 2]|uniref:response regulator n=1 Tax=Flavobacterium sp. 2 TaxID=308053 RepID=UPI003CEC695A
MLYQNILIIDDDIDDSDIFIEAINSLNINVNCLAQNNSVAALEFLISTEILPDLIFLDYNMPVLNGNEFIEKIKTVERLRSIPVVIYSTYSEAAAEQLLIVQDGQKYITKPNSFSELKSLLKNILEGN